MDNLKKLTYLLLATIIAFMFVPTSSAFAYSGGLLSGQIFGMEDGTRTNALTDGDESTAIIIKRIVTGKVDHFVSTKGSPFERWNVNGYQIKGDGTWMLTLAAADNTSLKDIRPITSNGVKQTITQVSNVSGVVVSNFNTNDASLYEVDIFGSVVHLASQLSVSSVGDKEVGLSWTLLDAAESYNVYRSTTSGGPYTLVGSTNSSTTSYTDVSVDNNTTYYYVVTAANSGIESIYSNEVSATPLGTSRAFLTITMTNGLEKEYDLSMSEVNAFVDWYDAKDAGSGPAKYAFTKTWNKGPFKARTEYVIFDKILTFNVDEYDVVE
jgi:hypothetical protein